VFVAVVVAVVVVTAAVFAAAFAAAVLIFWREKYYILKDSRLNFLYLVAMFYTVTRFNLYLSGINICNSLSFRMQFPNFAGTKIS
jgi:hypothetical protein